MNCINGILTGLLSFSRQNDPVMREFDLILMTEQTLQFIQNTQIKKQIKIITKYETPLLSIIADQDQLKQVILNIILNAISEDGFISIEIQSLIIGGDTYYHIIVTDSRSGHKRRTIGKNI